MAERRGDLAHPPSRLPGEQESPASTPRMDDVTALLDRWNAGDPEALKALIGVVHGELRRLAGSLLRHERPDHTLQPTELVHEVYLRMSGLRSMPLNGRRHFSGAAAVAVAMRRILGDYARQRSADKRGGSEAQKVPLEFAFNLPIDLRVDCVRVDEDACVSGATAASAATLTAAYRQTGGILGDPNAPTWATARGRFASTSARSRSLTWQESSASGARCRSRRRTLVRRYESWGTCCAPRTIDRRTRVSLRRGWNSAAFKAWPAIVGRRDDATERSERATRSERSAKRKRERV
jgi:RNA polymerase sigma factor (TIGR02999 family)